MAHASGKKVAKKVGKHVDRLSTKQQYCFIVEIPFYDKAKKVAKG
jgi:hypothetical protein